MFRKVCDSSFIVGVPGVKSYGLETNGESLITFVSSFIAERISESLLLFSPSLVVSVSSIPVKEAYFFGDRVVVAFFFSFFLSCSVARSGRTDRKEYKIPGTISKY